MNFIGRVLVLAFITLRCRNKQLPNFSVLQNHSDYCSRFTVALFWDPGQKSNNHLTHAILCRREKSNSRAKQWLSNLSLIKPVHMAKIDVSRVERYNLLKEVMRK